MIPPDRYTSLQELLRDALIQFKTETALIEVRRKRELGRLSYLDFKRAAEPLARRMQDIGVGAGSRVAIVMSNQPAWLLSAYAALFRGAVLVPIDYKLTGPEQTALLSHCAPALLITEYAEWRKMGETAPVPSVWVTEAPDDIELAEAERWEATREDLAAPDFVPRERSDQATLVYSSGTGGDPKGCMLTHGNYLEQFRILGAVYPLVVGDRYFSILPTNHAIDFMSGFIGPLAGGATVVHQRTLRPELVHQTMKRYGITHMAVVPLLLEAFERRIREKLEESSEGRQRLFELLRTANASLTLDKPRRQLSKRLLGPVHDAFGGELKLLFCGGAFVDPQRARFFYDLGLPVAIGYGLTEAGTVLTVNDLSPFRPDSVGAPLEDIELEIRNKDDASAIGEVWAKGPTVFSGYLDDPEQTAEVLQDGWLKTGDLGWLDPAGHLHLVGRSKNMIVTAGGKNIYPEDIESSFEGLPCEELVVFAKNYVWPGGGLTDEELVAVVRKPEPELVDELVRKNRRLPDFKRIAGVVPWSEPFPRTASMKVKRGVLAAELREALGRDAVAPISGGQP